MGQGDDAGRGRHSTSSEASPPAAPPGPPGRHRARGSLGRVRAAGRRPLAALALLVAAVVVVAVALVAVTRSGDGDPEPVADRGPAPDLVAWADAQLPPGATLSADPAVAGALGEAGLGAGLLSTAAAGTPDAGPALEVVQGDDTGGGTVVASFSAGGDELTVVDPAAVPPDADQLDRRRRVGAALLANPMTQPPAAVAQRLREGTVDPRLLTLLAGLAARFGVQLADLPTADGEPATAPARAAVVAALDGAPVSEGSPALAELRSYLAAQLATFSPDEVELVDGGLLLRFRYVTDPDGAVTRGGG